MTEPSGIELPERKIHTVSELTQAIRLLLEKEFPSVWIQGEISNFKAAPSGHLYFTLKDRESQIRCVMFRGQSQFLKFRPEDGLEIIAWGRVAVYTPRGEYQLILDTMEPKGLGSLMLAFEQLRARLEKEGLFDPSRKRPLPRFPRTVGIVTSRKAAALRDMLRIAHRRSPNIDIIVSSTLVQGDRAPKDIVAALERLCRVPEIDVIIIGRGGGSIEDLWAFNDEHVVRAVANCPVPIVSAVGHETDVTLSDFAADVRASTPSMASEIVFPDRLEIQERILQLVSRLKGSMILQLENRRTAVNHELKRLYDPRRRIQERRQRLDDLVFRLEHAMRRRIRSCRDETGSALKRLRPEMLQRKVTLGRTECDRLVKRLERAIKGTLKHAKNDVEYLAARLDSLSPLAVLSRGYSITMRAEDGPRSGEVITDAATVDIGEDISIRLRRGELSCSVTNTTPDDDEGGDG